MSEVKGVNLTPEQIAALDGLVKVNKEVVDKTVDDLGDMILGGEYGPAIEVCKRAAITLKFSVDSKAARKRGLERLRSHLRNIQMAMKSDNEFAYKYELKAAFTAASGY